MIKQNEKLYWNVCPFHKIIRVMSYRSNFSETEPVGKPWNFAGCKLVRLDGYVRRFFQNSPVPSVRSRKKVVEPYLSKPGFAWVGLGKPDSVVIRTKGRSSRPGVNQA